MAITVTLIGERDRALEERLRTAGMRPTPLAADDLGSLAHPSSPMSDVVLLDLRANPQIPAALAMLKRQHPETGVVIIAAALDPAMMLEAMRAGVTECVTDLSGGDLEAAIVRLVAQRAGPDAGDIFALVGAKGGVGTTTAAVNVATALAKSGSTLLVDLHFAGGDAALFLGAEPRFSVLDALENTHRLDAAYFRSLVVRTKAGPDLLASAERTVGGSMDALRVRTLIDFASRHYRFTVLDIPRSDSSVLDALEAVTRIVVVANQELSTVRSAARLTTMVRRRYGKDKADVVLSRSDHSAEISVEDLERAVTSEVKAIFPSDYRAAVAGLNRGRPLAEDANTPLGRAFEAFARELAGLGADERPTERVSSGLFGRLRGRR